jgi:hypothetical protein
VPLEPDGERQQRQRVGLGRRDVVEHVLHQLVMDPAVGLVCSVYGNDADEPMVIALQDPHLEEAVLDRAARSRGQMPDPVPSRPRAGRTYEIPVAFKLASGRQS